MTKGIECELLNSFCRQSERTLIHLLYYFNLTAVPYTNTSDVPSITEDVA